MGEPPTGKVIDASLTVGGRGRGAGGRLDPATVQKYRKAWRKAESWCRSLGLQPMPWSSETLAHYAGVLLERGYAKATVDLHLAGIKAEHRWRGHPVPDGVAAWYVLRGAHNSEDPPSMVNNPRPSRRAVLAAIAEALDPATASGARDLAFVTLGWDLHAQVRALVALDVEDVADVDDGDGGLVVRLAGRYLTVAHTHDPVDVCPVEATQVWLRHLRMAGVRSGPLFRGVDRGQNIAGTGGPYGGPNPLAPRFTESGAGRMWSRLVARAHLPAGSSPKDMRLASAEDAARNGVPVQEIVARGGWSPGTARVINRLMTAALEGPAR